MNLDLKHSKYKPLIKLIILISLSIAISIFTYKSIGSSLKLGIDPSWEFALNYFAANHLILGKDVFFTYGPLGYLLFPVPINNHLFQGALFWFVLRFLLVISLIQLTLRLNTTTHFFNRIILCVVGLFFFSIVNVYIVLFLTTTLILLFNIEKKSTGYLYLASGSTIIALLIKPGLSIYCFLALFGYLFIFSWLEKNYIIISKNLCSVILFYFLGWIIIYQSLSGSINYLLSSYQFIAGYDAAMSWDQPMNWLYFLGTIALLIFSFLPFLGKRCLDRNGAIIYLLLVIPTLLSFKYSYGRLNEHIYNITFLLFMVYSYMLLLIGDPLRFILLLMLGLGSVQLQLLNQKAIGFPLTRFYNHLITPFYFEQELIHPAQYKQQLINESHYDLAEGKVKLSTIQQLTRSTFDIYPYNLSLIPANQLIWQPRPVPQSYTAYTPYLDNLNARFFQQGKGANYLIWHDAQNLDEIDNRYVFNSEPNTVFEIFNHYQLLFHGNDYAVFKKEKEVKYYPFTYLSRTTGNWNAWITIPNNTVDLLRARIFTSQKPLQVLKRLIYKQSPVWIDYRFADGKIRTYRLILSTAENGIWIKPFITSLVKPAAQQVTAFRLRHDPSDFLVDRVTIEWIGNKCHISA